MNEEERASNDDGIEGIGPRDFFNIGKCIGLIGKDIDIRKYKKNMDHLDRLFKKKIDAEVTDVKDAIKAFRNSIVASQRTLMKEQNRFLKDIIKSMKNANELLDKQTRNHVVVNNSVTQLLTLVLKRANEAHEISKNLNSDIGNAITGFNGKYDSFFQSIEEKQSQYLDELKKLDLEFRDLERGFIMGKALRTGGRE